MSCGDKSDVGKSYACVAYFRMIVETGITMIGLRCLHDLLEVYPTG